MVHYIIQVISIYLDENFFRLAEVVSGEVEEQRQRVRDVETKMAVMEEQHRQQIKTIALEAERQVAVKEQECQQTITTAYGKYFYHL